jgi:hypothetical protein
VRSSFVKEFRCLTLNEMMRRIFIFSLSALDFNCGVLLFQTFSTTLFLIEKRVHRRGGVKAVASSRWANHFERGWGQYPPTRNSDGRGNANELGDAGHRPRQKYLFYLTGMQHPGKPLWRDRVRCSQECPNLLGHLGLGVGP